MSFISAANVSHVRNLLASEAEMEAQAKAATQGQTMGLGGLSADYPEPPQKPTLREALAYQRANLQARLDSMDQLIAMIDENPVLNAFHEVLTKINGLY